MKSFTLTLLFFFAAFGAATAQLVISEIMYNPPESSTDSLEFIEIHNPGAVAVNVDQYILAFSNTTDTLSGSIPAGGFYVSAVKASAFETAFGVAPTSIWSGSGLSNSGREITLTDASGGTVTAVTYDDAAPWPTSPDGGGPSLELCNLASPDNGASWEASTTSTGFSTNGAEVFASPFSLPSCGAPPGPAAFPLRTIGEMITVDATGTLDSINATATLEGTVNSVDFNGGNGLEFFMQDATGGIKIVSSQNLYTVAIGDVLSIRGTLEQRNGAAQFSTDSIRVVNTAMPVTPKVVTDITEGDQGQLVTLQNFALVNADDWSTNSSFNIEITNGSVVVLMRIDENTDFAGMNEPTGTFDVTGIANQFDSSSPYDEGYQIQPRFTADISPYNPGTGPSYPLRAIDDINNVDPTTGIADSLTKRVTIDGIVLGFNVRSGGTGGTQFTVVDFVGNGIGVFNLRDDLGYTVVEGDNVEVRGVVSQFNGLTQVEAEEITFINSNNTLPEPAAVELLDEFSESRLVTLSGLTIVDPNEWLADPSASYNVRFTNINQDTFVIRIDDGSTVGDLEAPTVGETIVITGIGGQFDRDAPLLDDYQLFPRSRADFPFIFSTIEIDPNELFTVLPQGDGWQLEVKQAIKQLELHDIQGRLVSRLTNVQPGRVFLAKPVASSYVLSALTPENRRGSVVLTQ